MSTTASDQGAGNIDEGLVEEVFIKTVEAEERVALLEELVNLGVGLPEVENFFEGVTQACRNEKNKSRKENLIIDTMKEKLHDAQDERKKLRLRKARTIKFVYRTWGRESARTKSFFRRIVRRARNHRLELQSKYKKKVTHLKHKYKSHEAEFKLPDSIKKYKEADCFRPGYQPDPAPDTEDRTPLVYGDVDLDSDEVEAIIMDPKFAVHEVLDIEEFEVDIEIALAKMRWDKMSEKDGDNEMTAEEKLQEEIEEAEERLTYNPANKTVDMRKYRATDAPMNATIKLPRGQSPEFEAGLQVRKQEWMAAAREYIKANCDSKGRQEDNLTEAQRRGIKKLQKRVNDGSIVICPTDKSGKMCVMPMDMYMAAGELHVAKDKEVTIEFAEKTQKQLQGHTSAWLKILNVGENHQHEDRHRRTFIMKSLNIAPLYLLIKSHKPYTDSDQKENKPPSTRPVASAVQGFNVQFSNLISPILDSIANEQKGKVEIISSEDGLNIIDMYNKSLDKQYVFSDPIEISNTKNPSCRK